MPCRQASGQQEGGQLADLDDLWSDLDGLPGLDLPPLSPAPASGAGRRGGAPAPHFGHSLGGYTGSFY